MKKIISITLAFIMILAAVPADALSYKTIHNIIASVKTMENGETPPEEQQPSGTAEPTVPSTVEPTAEEPTVPPTTEEPTVPPTEDPTVPPTDEPTVPPLQEPTPSQTVEPTPTATPTPTVTPTPTATPTPTPTPTPVPTPTPFLQLVSGSTYTEDGSYLNGVKADTKAETVIAAFVAGDIRIVDNTGSVLNKSALVGTGAKVQLMDGDEVIDSLTVIVMGDANGDGKLDTNDTAAMQSHLEKQSILTANFFAAANIVADADIDSRDILALQRMIASVNGNVSTNSEANKVKFAFSASSAYPNDEIEVTVSVAASSDALHAFEIYINASNDAFEFVNGSLSYLVSLSKTAMGGAAYYPLTKQIMFSWSDASSALSGEMQAVKFKVKVKENFAGGYAQYDCESTSFMLDGAGNSLNMKVESDKIAVYAQDSEFEYTVTDEKATITGYKGTGGKVVIPDTISGFDVVAIGDSVFADNRSIAGVEIGENVTSIGNKAFSGCDMLTDVSCKSTVLTSIGNEAFYGCARLRAAALPVSVVTIGDYAFYGCSGLLNVSLPDSLKTIGDYAFYGCSNIVSVNISMNVESIGYKALSGCAKLRTITVSSSNTVFASVDGMLCSADKATLILCPAAKSGEITVPSTITKIEASAFESCSDITRVDILEGVTSIGEEAFFGCVRLAGVYFHGAAPAFVGDNAFYGTAGEFTVYCTEANLSTFAPNGETQYKGYPLAVFDNTPAPTAHPDYEYTVSGSSAIITGYKGQGGYIEIPGAMLEYPVTEIAENAFSDNTAITGATIPDSVVKIGDKAFYGCKALENVTIGNGVKNIGEYAFAYSGINSISVPDGVETIGRRALANCPNITDAMISSSVRSINGNVFEYCVSLVQITVQEGNSNYSSANGVLYDKNRNKLIACPAGKSGSYSMASSTTIIGEYAFAGCEKLTKISLSAFVNTIESHAFDSCTSLMSFEVSVFNTDFIALDGMLYTYDRTVFVACPAGKAGSSSVLDGTVSIAANAFNSSVLTSIAIPESVTDIYEYAFSSCRNLTSIDIPSNVVMIGNYAFYGCTKLQKADFYGKPPAAFGEGVFDGAAQNFTIRYLEWNKSVWSPTGTNSYKGYPITSFAILRTNEKSSYTIESKYRRIRGIAETTTVEKFLSNFMTASMRVIDASGNVLYNVNYVGTGCRIQLLDSNGNVSDELYVVVSGDATGDAVINSRDIAAMQSHLLEYTTLNGSYLNAGDTTGDGSVNSKDIVAVLKHMIGVKSING
ncbi:MAG: leucine-rich repeat protein [Clostridia bacterium]|nr:leucine-rich repeat protein [Clostridia bacterium]